MNACDQRSFSDLEQSRILCLGNALLISVNTVKGIPKRHAHRPTWSNNPSLKLSPVTLDYANKRLHSAVHILIAINDGVFESVVSVTLATTEVGCISLVTHSETEISIPGARCSMLLGRKKAGWGRRTWTAVRLQQRSQLAGGGLLELDELFKISLGWCKQPGPMDTRGEQSLDAAALTGNQVWALSSIFVARWEASFSLCCLEADAQTSVLLGRFFDGVTGIWFWCSLSSFSNYCWY